MVMLYLSESIYATTTIPIRILGFHRIFLKDFLTVVMMDSSFKTARYYRSHVNPPEIWMLKRNVYL